MNKKIAIVTGANQGLGFALVKMLCQKLGKQGQVYLTARNEARGLKAVKELQAQGFDPQFHLLDVDNQASVDKFQAYLSEKYEGIDIFIHNAAARQSPDKDPKEEIEQFVRVNNFGTIRILKSFVPLLNDKSHFLVIASSFGSLRHLAEPLQAQFEAEKIDFEQLEKALTTYVEQVKNGTDIEAGYPNWMNVVSKIGQVSALRIVAKEQNTEAQKRQIMFNSICPGLLDTEASRPWFKSMENALKPDDATDAIWWVIEQGWQEEMYGELYQHQRKLAWKLN